MSNNRGTAEQFIIETMLILKELEAGLTLQEVIANSELSGSLLQQTIYTICRNYISFTWIIENAVEGSIKVKHRRLIYWVLCQYFYSTTMPGAKAVSIAVDVARVEWKKNVAKYINFVLRRITELTPEEWCERLKNEAPKHVQYNLPKSLWDSWSKMFSEEQVIAISQCLQQPALPTMRIRKDKILPEELQQFIKEIPSPQWAPNIKMWEVINGREFFNHELCDTRDFYCQDPATLAAPVLLDAKPNETIADFCCAPGGKTAILAESMNKQGILWCCDRSKRRLEKTMKNLEEFYDFCNFKVQDATTPEFENDTFDGILLDVPCSNSGVIRRRPDVRMHYNADNVKELIELQARILQASSPLVKVGGRIIYSTCSIDVYENKKQVDQFLAENNNFELETDCTMLPCMENDGGYAAKLVRKF